MEYTQTGTPYYTSPEVWNGQPYDSKSDIWSLGCVTFKMLALRPPFRAENMEKLYNKVVRGQYGKISDRYSEDIREIINFMLKVNPQDRPSCGPSGHTHKTKCCTPHTPKNRRFSRKCFIYSRLSHFQTAFFDVKWGV